MTRLENILETSSQDLLKTSWRHLEDVWPRRIFCCWPRRLEDVLKTYSEDLYLKRILSPWSRRLEDVFWRRRQNTSSKRLQDVFIKTNVCWVTTSCMRHFLSHLLTLKIFRWASFKTASGFFLVVDSSYQILKNLICLFLYITSRFACEISVTETAKIWKNLTKRKYEWARLFQLRSRKEWKPKRYRNRICILKDTALLHIILSSIFNYHTVIEKFCILSFLTTISCSSSKILYIVASPFLI